MPCARSLFASCVVNDFRARQPAVMQPAKEPFGLHLETAWEYRNFDFHITLLL
jgi:hypothetical protein